MGKPINLDLRQCLYHLKPGEPYAEVVSRLDAGLESLQEVGPGSRLVKIDQAQ
jgi:hypothetical protein